MVFDVTSLGFSVTNGDQSFSQYVQFVADAGVDITGLIFTNANPPTDAFEVANFTVTAPVPEPETYALMLAGLAAVGFISRRRRRS
ncbi:MAG: PEP-CTERM sorting domain-containing protein [Burkholderiales bacterium]|nr:PEP-CTERM sorting domain-containing protein [Burkholderiales bacterium]